MTEIIDWVGRGIDAVGVAVIVVGAAVTAILAIRDARAGLGNVYGRARRRFGRAILLGLEVLVAADIVRTVAIEPTFESLGVLAVLVLTRTFLSLALEVELDGRWPWQPPRPGEPPEVTAPG